MNSILAESVTFAITESFQNQRFITVRTHHKDGDQEITGIVTKVDHPLGKIKVSHEHGSEWILIPDISDVLIGLDE